jgi:RNA polymerase sigma factor (sigma-70 family)
MSALPDDVLADTMSVDIVDPTDLDEPTLLQLSRDGDAEAFAELFRRHRVLAVRIAARMSRALDPEEVAAEAFARVWSALARGKGPDRAFRPYLATAVRNVAMNTQRSAREVATDPWQLPETFADPDETSTAIAEGQQVGEAFASLPERWQQALWATEVEGKPVADYARTIGVSANAAAALCLRAREGLKAAWLQAHVHRRSADPECQWVLGHLGAHERHRLPPGQRRRVEAHLDDCAGCRRSLDRLAFIGRALKVSILFAGTGSSFVALKAALGTAAGAGTGAVLAAKPAIGLIGPALGRLVEAGRRATASLRPTMRVARAAGHAVASGGVGVATVVTGAVAVTAVAVATAFGPVAGAPFRAPVAEQVLVAPVPSPATSEPSPTPRQTSASPKPPDATKTPRPGTGPAGTARHTSSRPKSPRASAGGSKPTAPPSTASPAPSVGPTWPVRPNPAGPPTTIPIPSVPTPGSPITAPTLKPVVRGSLARPTSTRRLVGTGHCPRPKVPRHRHGERFEARPHRDGISGRRHLEWSRERGTLDRSGGRGSADRLRGGAPPPAELSGAGDAGAHRGSDNSAGEGGG